MHSCLVCVVVALVISSIVSSVECSSRRRCKRTNDCRPGECCAAVKRKTYKFCKQNSQLGDDCSLFSKPGTVTNWQCPCDVGLTCALSSVNKHAGKYHQKHTCVRVPPVEDESVEKPTTQKWQTAKWNSTR